MGQAGAGTGISRRDALRRIGAGAAVAWSAPLVLTVGASASAGSPAPGPQTCPPGFANCDGSGCNCPTSGTGLACCRGGNPSATGTCQTVHANGLGQNFYDCAPPGTYDVTRALEACAAYTGNPGSCSLAACGGGSTNNVVCGKGPRGCACWQYSGSASGHVSQPDGNPADCSCPASTDPVWT